MSVPLRAPATILAEAPSAAPSVNAATAAAGVLEVLPDRAASCCLHGAMITTEVTSAILQRIRRFAMPDGLPECRGTWLRQEGEMRFEPDKPWLPFRAEQWFIGDGIDFRWVAQARMAPLVRARVVDAFENGKGSLTARVFGFITVANASGSVANRAEAMRGLAELPWRPFAFRDGRHITWEAIAPNRLRGSFDDAVSVDFDVDVDGAVLSAYASTRPRIVGKTVVKTPWVGSFGEYKVFESLRVPTRAEVSWELPDGPFNYWRGRVVEFRVLR